MTDKEKFENLFKELGVEYSENEYTNGESAIVLMTKSAFDMVFDEHGNLLYFD